MTDKIKQWAEAMRTVGMPWSVTFALLAVVAWLIYLNSQMLVVIERNTAAIQAQTMATEALREEVRRER